MGKAGGLARFRVSSSRRGEVPAERAEGGELTCSFVA